MTRTVLAGGRLFDGTGTDPAAADVAVEDGRIVDVGTGLDGDVVVDVAGRTVLPGLLRLPHPRRASRRSTCGSRPSSPFSLEFYEAAENLRADPSIGITSIRDAGGADLGIKTGGRATG